MSGPTFAERGTLAALTVICCGLVLTSPFLLAFGFNADQLTLPSLVEDLLYNPYFSLLTWMLPRAPYSFPDLPIFIAVRIIVKDSYVALLTHAVLHMIATAVAAKLILNKALARPELARLALAIFLAFCAITIAIAPRVSNGELLLWNFAPIGHATAVVFALMMFRVYDAVIVDRAVWKHALAIALCAASIHSDKLFILTFCMPFGAVMAFVGWRVRSIKLPLLFIMETAIAVGLSLAIDRPLLLQTMIAIEFKLFERLATVLQVARELGPAPWIIMTAGVIAALRLAWLAFFERPDDAENDSSRRALVFISTLTGVGAATCVLLWIGPRTVYGRYAVGLTLGSLLSIAILMARTTRWSNVSRSAVLVGALAVTLASALTARIADPRTPLDERLTISSYMNECREKYGLEAGLAQYWLARRLSMATKWKIHVNQFEPGRPHLFFWGSNFLWFYNQLSTGRPLQSNFIIQDGLNRADIERMYGPPTLEVDCGPYRVLIYRNGEALQNAALKTLHVWPQIMADRAPAGSLRNTSRELSLTFGGMGSLTGVKTDGAVEARAPRDPPGFLLHGPYIRLPAGSYQLDVVVACTDNAVGHIIDVSADVGKDVLAKLTALRCDGQRHTFSLPFTLTAPRDQVEFRSLFGGAGTLEVSRMLLHRTQGDRR